jgi:NADPH2:quinone reductase
MQAITYKDCGGAREVLRLERLKRPKPGAGEVLVRLKTSGVNPSDVKNRRGRPDRALAYDRVIPHSDGAGVIEAVGEAVDSARIGESVWLYNGQWQRPFGTAAQYIALPAEQAVPLPAGVGYDAGACLGIPALTAWWAVNMEESLAGRRVLVSGGAGSVGFYAIQFAKLLGAEVIATVSSAQKAKVAREAGADHIIDYKREKVVPRVLELSDGEGVDRAIEVDLAGNGDFLAEIVKPHGLAVVYGSNAPQVTLPFTNFLFRSITLRFMLVYDLTPGARKGAIESLNRILEDGALKHRVGARFALAECAEAHELVEAGSALGNVVLTIDDEG